MRTQNKEIKDLKIQAILAAVTIVGMIALAGTRQRGMAGGVPVGSAPRVTSVTQITHDGYPKTSLLADDAQLYVTELPETNRVIAKVILGAPTKNVPARSVLPGPFPSSQALALSPDHSKLLVSSKSTSGESQFWMLPVAKGAPERVGELSGRDAAWSPDGRQIVFAKGASLYSSNPDGSEAHEFYAAGGSIFGVRFSPDGKRIRFTVSDSEANTTALWEVGRDGLNPRPLLEDFQFKSTVCCGSWTADGRYYIFQASQSIPNTTTVVTSLWALPEGGEAAAPIPLTSGPMSFGNVTSAGDGKKIWAIGVQPTVEVVKYLPDKQKFVPVIAGLSATDVDFSADGKWITYVAIPDGTLWRARANGTERLQLTPGSEQAALPRWSPDGKQIAFVSMKRGESWKLYLISANGGDPQPVVEENGSQIDANWSADGSKLMFGDFSGDALGLTIRVLDFKTHKTETVPGSQGLFSPRWSPNGRYVVALTPGNKALRIYDFQTQQWSDWIMAAGGVNYPVWSADSEYLYFDDFINDEESIRRVKIGSGEVERVFVLGSMERYMGPLGTWSGRTPDGSWMFVRDRSTQEVYQLSLELP